MSTPTIPGLEPPAAAPSGVGPMAKAVERQLEALATAGILSHYHAATVELVRVLAGATDRAAAGRDKAYGTAQIARELREALAALPTPPEQTGDAFDVLVSHLRASPIRDLTDPVAGQ